MNKDYKIILMDLEGNTHTEYFSPIIPSVNDTIVLDEDNNFIVQSRHFSILNLKVLLLGELDIQKENK